MKTASLSATLVLAAFLVLPSPSRAGAWVLPKGQWWFHVGFLYQTTDERYFLDGERIPFFFDGHNETTAGFFDLRRGMGKGVELLVQVPMYSIRFDDLADQRKSTGIGDVRAGARWEFLHGPVIATVGGVVKFPTGEFINDAEVVPVGEGQYDFEISGEIGHSLWPRPGYVNGQVGYRFRATNQENGITPGDEIFWSFEGGYRILPRLMLKGMARGLYGFESTSFGLLIQTLRREVVYIEPGVVFSISPSQSLEVTVPVSIRGRNWPAGPVLNIGFYQTF